MKQNEQGLHQTELGPVEMKETGPTERTARQDNCPVGRSDTSETSLLGIDLLSNSRCAASKICSIRTGLTELRHESVGPSEGTERSRSIPSDHPTRPHLPHARHARRGASDGPDGIHRSIAAHTHDRPARQTDCELLSYYSLKNRWFRPSFSLARSYAMASSD